MNLRDMAPDTARPVMIDAPKLQRMELSGGGETTILHSSWVVDLLQADPARLYLRVLLLGFALAMGGMLAMALPLLLMRALA